MKIHKSDTVIVLTGAYKGQVGEVIKVSPKHEKVMIEGVNLVKKHLKPSQVNPDGGIIEKEAWIHVSNVALYDPKNKVGSRVGYTTDAKGNKVRKFTSTRSSGQIVK